jgi:protein-S-isoprenylcysteine O-methyltransferase Ste14
MNALYLFLLGLLALILGILISGLWLRKNPSKANVEKSSRIVHFLLFAGLAAPFLVIFLYPGRTHLDEIIGLDSLPTKHFFLLAESVWQCPVYFCSGSILLTLANLLGLIPAHIFFLRFFDEMELELRFGDLYKNYIQKVPFLIPKFTVN